MKPAARRRVRNSMEGAERMKGGGGLLLVGRRGEGGGVDGFAGGDGGEDFGDVHAGFGREAVGDLLVLGGVGGFEGAGDAAFAGIIGGEG